MYALNFGYLSYLTKGNMPTDFQRGYEYGARLGASNPLYALTSLAMFCVPPFFMLVAAGAGYFFIDRYQKRKAAANPPMPGVGQ